MLYYNMGLWLRKELKKKKKDYASIKPWKDKNVKSILNFHGVGAFIRSLG